MTHADLSLPMIPTTCLLFRLTVTIHISRNEGISVPRQCCTEMTHRIFEGRRRSITDAGSALSKQRRNSWAGNVSGEVRSWAGWKWFTDWLFSSQNIFLDVITALQPSLTISSAAPTLTRIFPAAIVFHYCSPSFKAASPQPRLHHIL